MKAPIAEINMFLKFSDKKFFFITLRLTHFMDKYKFHPLRSGDTFILLISLITFSHLIHSLLFCSAAYSEALSIATVSASVSYTHLRAHET